MAPYLIGLTGNIGSGKSTAAKIFMELGAQVVSGDELGKIVLEESSDLLQAVHDRFGGEVFDESGLLNRRALGQKVFSNRQDLDWLTAMTFPAIHERWLKIVRASAHPVLVLDAALIFEWGIEGEFDLLALVAAQPATIESRFHGSPGKIQDIRTRLAMQQAAEILKTKVDAILQNDRSVDDLRAQINRLWQSIVQPNLQLRRF